VIENAVTPALCDSILEEYAESHEWVEARISDGINTDVRNCSTIGMSFEDIISKNPDKRRVLDKYMHVSASSVIRKYNEYFPMCMIDQDSGYDLLRYKTGQFYKTHSDSFKARPRAISCSFALNNDFEGGEFCFFDKELKYQLSKGSALLFPSNFMYPHEVMPVTSGTRYSIVTWFI